MTAATVTESPIAVLRNRRFLALWVAQVVTQVGGKWSCMG